MLIGVNFYKAARLEPPPPFFKLLGFRASEPPNFLSHATPIAVFCGLPNNKMTPNDIHANQTTSFVRIQQWKLQAVSRVVLEFFKAISCSGLSHDIVLPGTIDNSVLSLIISVLSFKGIHNGICNLRFFSMYTSLLQGWMSMTLHSAVRCSVTRWITQYLEEVYAYEDADSSVPRWCC